MNIEEESNVFGMEEGCPQHGSDRMAECTVCGGEFCSRCFPRSSVCADCAEGSEVVEEARGEDVTDVSKLCKLIDVNESESQAASDEEESP